MCGSGHNGASWWAVQLLQTLQICSCRISRHLRCCHCADGTKGMLQAPKHRLVPSSAVAATFSRKPDDQLQHREDGQLQRK